MTRTKRYYSPEFKRETINLAEEGEKSIPQLAEDLGIHSSLIYRWRQELDEDDQEAFRGQGQRKRVDEENRRLKRELAQAKQERDILKKALTIFSQSQV